MALYDTASLSDFKNKQEQGIFGFSYEGAVTKPAAPKSIPINENPNVSPLVKEAINLREFSERSRNKSPDNLLDRYIEQSKAIAPPEMKDADETVTQKILNAPTTPVPKAETTPEVLKRVSTPVKDPVPFKANAVNPSKDTSLGNIKRFKQQIADKESYGGDYKLASKVSSATGKYQFLWGTWSGKIMKQTGVKSRQEFLNNPAAQEKFFEWYTSNEIAPSVRRLKQSAAAVGLTENEVARLVHFRGEGGTRQLLRNPKGWDTRDSANNMGVNEYLGRGKWAPKK